jgi:hypothetical protein
MSDNNEVSILHDLIAGGIAGSASVVVGHPMDTIKVRMQTGTSSALSGGFRSLFKGMAAPLSSATAVNAIIFASYGSSTRIWEDVFENGNHSSTAEASTLKAFTCGSIAGTVQAFIICPMEHIKCRLQVQSQLYKGPTDACTQIIKNHGLCRGLYRGMGVTLWRETPAFGAYFATYDSIKARVETILEDKNDHHPIPTHGHAWAASALAGGISGAFTWAIIYPFDVIKSRMQTSPLDRNLQKGMWTVGSDLVKKHGWQYMFRGLGVTLVRAFPVNAIIFPVYEFTLMQLGDGKLNMNLNFSNKYTEQSSKQGKTLEL